MPMGLRDRDFIIANRSNSFGHCLLWTQKHYKISLGSRIHLLGTVDQNPGDSCLRIKIAWQKLSLLTRMGIKTQNRSKEFVLV